MRRELERLEIPGEHDARTRTWAVVQAAHAEREPVPRRRPFVRPVLVLATVLAVVAAAASPPGRAVIDSVREAIGVERAAPALVSLPTQGRLLVAAEGGAWVVRRDGSRRRLGDYREAAWSPFGRFVVAAGDGELVALEPDGDVRWSLGRRDVRHPAWGGTATDTRIAYLARGELRVVAGDGTGDRRACAVPAAEVTPAWRPGARHELAFAGRDGRVHVVAADGCRVRFRAPAAGRVASLEWSGDGRRLLVVRGGRVDVLTAGGAPFTGIRPAGGRVAAATFRPGSHAVAYAVEGDGRTRVALVAEGGGVLFSGPGRVAGLEWSPDGRWLLLSWRAADQWLFVRADGRRRVEAVSSISRQFHSTTFPTVAGWCCASSR